MKNYDIYFRRNGKERFWEVEKDQDLYGFKNLLEIILESTKEERLEIKLILRKKKDK